MTTEFRKKRSISALDATIAVFLVKLDWFFTKCEIWLPTSNNGFDVIILRDGQAGESLREILAEVTPVYWHQSNLDWKILLRIQGPRVDWRWDVHTCTIVDGLDCIQLECQPNSPEIPASLKAILLSGTARLVTGPIKELVKHVKRMG